MTTTTPADYATADSNEIGASRRILSDTHEVFNQATPLENYNMFERDQALSEALVREGGGWGEPGVAALGKTLGSAEWIERGFQANRSTPELFTHDRFGHRVDHVEYHPAYHDVMGLAVEHNIHASPWSDPKPGAHVVRMAKNYLYTQNEAGSACPLTMTFACVPAIRDTASVAAAWLPKIFDQRYDPTNAPLEQKTGATIGMAMTEKQGGTDVRANTTTAVPVAGRGPGEAYEIIGHKWFVSAPMSDAFLTLAQTDQGLSCFLLPRWRPDGTRNEFHVQRLKDKMGNRSNASSEVELRGAHAVLLGEEGRGVATIIEMVALTRYDCMIGSTALMRQAVAQVTHHIAQRSVMGANLIDQPLMQNVVADLCLEVEGALAMTARTARALDNEALNNQDSEAERLLTRFMTAIGKYWICKRATSHIGEAMECLGGGGYVEDSILPRLYREAPVNSIWEGSGNVQVLDVLRAMTKTPDVVDVYFDELETALGANTMYDAYVGALKAEFTHVEDFEYQGRHYVERLAKAMQAAQLVKAGNALVSDAFCSSRLGESRGLNYGNLASGTDCAAIIERARPNVG